MSNYKQQLVTKWERAKGPMSIKSIEDPYIKENLATLLENQERKDFNGNQIFLGENIASDGATSTGSMDYAFQGPHGTGVKGDGGPSNWTGGDWRFRPVALALQRRTFPDLFANKVVGVQAMSTPVGLSYALRFTYNKNGSGTEAAWDDVDKMAGYTGNKDNSQTLYPGVTSAGDPAPGSVSGTNALGNLTSAGELLQISDSRSDCGVQGTDGVWTNPDGDTGCVSPEPEWTQLGLRIDQQAIEALTRKLAASFSLEAAQDIKAMHGIDIEREMVNVLQYEITAELDRELLSALKRVATDPAKEGVIVPAVDVTNGDDFGRWNGERYMSIISAIIYQANQIAVSTRRGPGNFVIVSPDIATALQAAGHQFVNYEQNVNPGTTMAAIGKLNGTIDVYRDQYANTSYALVGYKGPGVSDAGVIFSPYIMGLQNRAISPDDFSPRVGVMSRYAVTDSLLGAGRYYRLIPFMNVSKLIPGVRTDKM